MMHGGCHEKMPVVAVKDGERVPGSGCRLDCLHRAAVMEYREAKGASDEARKLAREDASHGFRSEGAEWDAANPAWTFKDFLISRRQPAA